MRSIHRTDNKTLTSSTSTPTMRAKLSDTQLDYSNKSLLSVLLNQIVMHTLLGRRLQGTLFCNKYPSQGHWPPQERREVEPKVDSFFWFVFVVRWWLNSFQGHLDNNPFEWTFCRQCDATHKLTVRNISTLGLRKSRSCTCCQKEYVFVKLDDRVHNIHEVTPRLKIRLYAFLLVLFFTGIKSRFVTSSPSFSRRSW